MKYIIAAKDTCICGRSDSSRRSSGSVTDNLWPMAAVRRVILSGHGSRSNFRGSIVGAQYARQRTQLANELGNYFDFLLPRTSWNIK